VFRLLCYRQWQELPFRVQFLLFYIQLFHAYVAQDTMLGSYIVHALPLA
jgi:hypothetical protein